MATDRRARSGAPPQAGARIGSLEQLDAVLGTTAVARRELVAAALAEQAPPAEALAVLARALGAIEALPATAAGRTVAEAAGGPPIAVPLDTETTELRRDLLFFESGEAALRRALAREIPELEDEVAAGVAALGGAVPAALLADRDGTLVPYSARYAGSVQSGWSGTALARFARGLPGAAVVLSSGPLEGPGLVDLSVTPPGALVLAASKGREWVDAAGARGRLPLIPEQQRLLDELDRRLTRLLEEPGNRRFARIGSGFQRKYGQLAVARQDVAGSVPEPESRSFLESVRGLVAEVDRGGRALRAEDTGRDVEIHLTVRDAGGRDWREFDKGDGVRLLAQELPLDLSRGPCLVCGDTDADLPMLAAAAERAPEVRALFVVREDGLRRKLAEIAPEAVRVGRPETLVAILAALAARA